MVRLTKGSKHEQKTFDNIQNPLFDEMQIFLTSTCLLINLPKKVKVLNTFNQGDDRNLCLLDCCVLEQIAPNDDVASDQYVL